MLVIFDDVVGIVCDECGVGGSMDCLTEKERTRELEAEGWEAVYCDDLGTFIVICPTCTGDLKDTRVQELAADRPDHVLGGEPIGRPDAKQ